MRSSPSLGWWSLQAGLWVQLPTLEGSAGPPESSLASVAVSASGFDLSFGRMGIKESATAIPLREGFI